MQAKFPDARKDQFLMRIKKLVGKDNKEGKLIKTEGGKFKFTASELFKPKKKPIAKHKPKITPQ